MEHEIETAFCEDSTRQFIFSIDEALINFLNQKKDEEITFEAMNSYQRKLVHLIVQHYQISSRSIEEKSNKETNQEENKSGDPLKKVNVIKTKDSKCPMLRLKDYLTRSQQQKHDGMQKGFFRNTNNQERQRAEEEKVIFKGRGKARWRPEDYGNYRFEGDNFPTTTFTPKKEEQQYVEKRIVQEEKEASDGNGNKESPENHQSSNDKIKPVPKQESQKKETRTKMLQMINGILGGNRNPRREEDAHSNQIMQSKPKENTQTAEKEFDLRSQNSQKCSQQGLRRQESLPKPDNFLPSTNHILVIYEVIEDLSTIDIEDIIQKNFNMKASARLQETIPQGVLVFESDMDAEKVFRSDQQQLQAFKLAKFARDDNKILSEAFAREYFNVANLRPKANKSAAIRMINGHLKFK